MIIVQALKNKLVFQSYPKRVYMNAFGCFLSFMHIKNSSLGFSWSRGAGLELGYHTKYINVYLGSFIFTFGKGSSSPYLLKEPAEPCVIE